MFRLALESKSCLYKNLSHSILTQKNLCAKLGKVLRGRIIVHIHWCLGNLKKTYLSNPRLPKFEVWRPMFECYPATRSNIGRSNIGIIAIVPKLPMFEDWLWMFECRCLNIGPFKRLPIFEQGLMTNMYDYTLPIEPAKMLRIILAQRRSEYRSSL